VRAARHREPVRTATGRAPQGWVGTARQPAPEGVGGGTGGARFLVGSHVCRAAVRRDETNGTATSPNEIASGLAFRSWSEEATDGLVTTLVRSRIKREAPASRALMPAGPLACPDGLRGATRGQFPAPRERTSGRGARRRRPSWPPPIGSSVAAARGSARLPGAIRCLPADELRWSREEQGGKKG